MSKQIVIDRDDVELLKIVLDDWIGCVQDIDEFDTERDQEEHIELVERTRNLLARLQS